MVTDLFSHFKEKGKIVKLHKAENIKKTSSDAIEHLLGQKTMKKGALNAHNSRLRVAKSEDVILVPNCPVPLTISAVFSYTKCESAERQTHVYVDDESGYVVIIEKTTPFHPFKNAMMQALCSVTEIELLVDDSTATPTFPVYAVVDRKKYRFFQMDKKGYDSSAEYALVAYINDSFCAYVKKSGYVIVVFEINLFSNFFIIITPFIVYFFLQ